METAKTYLENKLKTLETSTNFVDTTAYTKTKEKIDKIYQEKIELEVNLIGTRMEKNTQSSF